MGLSMVEFGCGTGITGITYLSACPSPEQGPRQYRFTDGAPLAVCNAQQNCTANQVLGSGGGSNGGSSGGSNNGGMEELESQKDTVSSSVLFSVVDWIDVKTSLASISSSSPHTTPSENDIAAPPPAAAAMYSDVDVIIGADLFYDPVVAETFVTDVVVPLLSAPGRTRHCLASTSIRNEGTWNQVLQMFNTFHLQWNVIQICSCPFGTNARVEIAHLVSKF